MNLNKSTYFRYNGIIHVHSVFSDGTRPIPEIAQIAHELDVDFLLITDHNTLRGKREGFEGWYGNVLVGIGSEVNDAQDKNHYLVFDVDEELGPHLPAEEYLMRVHQAGGLGIIAHPDEKRRHIARYKPYPWTLWDSELFHGIEIWNQMSEWMEGLTHFNKLWRIWQPRRSIISPKPETLERWDRLNLKRKVVGIGGVDAHGYLHQLWGPFSIRVFRYKVSFRSIRTHVLTAEPIKKNEDYRQALKKIYSAIKEARCFISHVYLGDASAFSFFAENDHGWATMGEGLIFEPDTVFKVELPREASVLFIHNGKILAQKTGRNLEFKGKERGVYRVEVHVENRPWIYSNHIRLE
ncbi:PHP domain-containing protein [Caldithrix abyssi]